MTEEIRNEAMDYVPEGMEFETDSEESKGGILKKVIGGVAATGIAAGVGLFVKKRNDKKRKKAFEGLPVEDLRSDEYKTETESAEE